MPTMRNRHNTTAKGKAPSKSSLRNLIVGALFLFVCVSSFFLYHSHVRADSAAKEKMLSKINHLKATLEQHNAIHDMQKKKIKRLSPEKVEPPPTIPQNEFDAVAKHPNQVEELKLELKKMTEKVSSLEKNVVLDKVDQNKLKKPLESEKKSSLRGTVNEVVRPEVVQNESTRVRINGAESLGIDTVLLIVASSKRPAYLKRCLEKVIEHHPMTGVSIVVSQDGESAEVSKVVQEAQESLKSKGAHLTAAGDLPPRLTHINHKTKTRFENGYFALSNHYEFAMKNAFDTQQVYSRSKFSKVNRIIILEEDLEISPDFFEYFGAVAPLLDADMQLLCASAWNDNGQKSHVRDPSALFRGDFFPGLGWMMNRRIYDELRTKWPKAYWDDWLREPNQRKDRHIIRPEISRTFHYGKNGVSANQFQSDYMDQMRLNTDFVKFGQMDLNYLRSESWDKHFMNIVDSAQLVTMKEFDKLVPKSTRQSDLTANPTGPKQYRVKYKGNAGFERAARWAGVMDNIKANVPRTAYHGIVSFWVGNVRLHLVPG